MLEPLSPQEVCEDQRKMREKILQENREKEKESQTLESSKSEDNQEERKDNQHEQWSVGCTTFIF